VGWIVRLMQIGADGEAPFVDVMTIKGPPQVWGCEGQSGIFASVV